jgi:hypothetical protein
MLPIPTSALQIALCPLWLREFIRVELAANVNRSPHCISTRLRVPEDAFGTVAFALDVPMEETSIAKLSTINSPITCIRFTLFFFDDMIYIA